MFAYFDDLVIIFVKINLNNVDDICIISINLG